LLDTLISFRPCFQGR